MKELESPSKAKSPAPKVAPSASRPPTMEQLKAMTTDELVKMLMSPEMSRPMNEPIRQQIIEILQKREGNAFVQRLLGKAAGLKAK
jgi:hypothetical protein